MIDRSPCNIRPLKQKHLDRLAGKGVSPEAVMHPGLISLANGVRASDGYFQYRDEGPDWLAFAQYSDIIFWRPATGELAYELGQAFALGEDVIENPATTAFGPLSIFPNPLSWLKAGRQGIVVVNWSWCFDWLRDLPEIALAHEVEGIYRGHMRPSHLPKISRLVLPSEFNSNQPVGA